MLFNKKDTLKDVLQVGGVAGTMGLHLVSGTVVGLVIGYKLDEWLPEYFQVHTKPWLTMIFTILGIVTGFKMVIEDTRRLQREAERKERDSRNSGKEQDVAERDDQPKD